MFSSGSCHLFEHYKNVNLYKEIITFLILTKKKIVIYSYFPLKKKVTNFKNTLLNNAIYTITIYGTVKKRPETKVPILIEYISIHDERPNTFVLPGIGSNLNSAVVPIV